MRAVTPMRISQSMRFRVDQHALERALRVVERAAHEDTEAHASQERMAKEEESPEFLQSPRK